MISIKRMFSFLWILAFLPFTSVHAQKASYYKSSTETYQTALELYQEGKYGSALNLFETLQSKSENNSSFAREAEFYYALCALKLENRNGEKLIDDFIRNNPNSSFCNKAYLEKGDYFFSTKKYDLALKSYEQVTENSLSVSEVEKIHFNKGYCYFSTDVPEKALSEFLKVNETDPTYGVPSLYYRSHLYYEAGNYDEALAGFKKIEGVPEYRSLASYYIAHILYMNENYSEALKYALPLMNTIEADRKQELSRVAGNCYFHLKQYDKALQLLSEYAKNHTLTDRSDNYRLGYCYYKTERYADAIPYLEAASSTPDAMSQNATYHLADCYVRTGDRNKALRAFSSASEMNFDEMIKEDALFNYAKLTYELSYSPFNEAIKAFDKYISLYPNTERNATAYDFLVQVYMTTRNYKEALSSIEKIRNKTTPIKKAYQRLTYYRGLELFSNQDFKEAQGMFKKSLADGQYDANLKANALFWSGETYFRLEDFRAAVSEYKAFLNSQGVAANPEFYRANYGIGYAYFKQKDYELALPWFKKVVNSEAGGDVRLYSDALNRLGDCYFSGRNFTMAMEAYAKSQKIGDYDPDYALFQLAFCNGMLRKDDQKIDQLNLLLKKYPGTSLGADALFEIGRTYEKIGQNNKALDSYQELIRKYPSSSLVSKALLQSGLTSYNLNDYKKSLGYYKQVVEKYPQSQDVQSALYGMKNSYVELNQVDEYVDYSNKIGGNAAVSKGEQDSLMYVAAEKLFMAGDSRSQKQLEKYLGAFPTGGSALNAHFYLAEIYYKDKEFPKALADYEFVTAASANSFSEAALAKAGELRYNTGDYKDALSHFLNLEKIGGSKLSLLTARQGIMSCYYSLNDYPAVIESADKLLKTENLNETVGAEARFMKGKALYQTKRPDLAFPLLKEAAKNTQTAEGAEAKYLTTQILFDQKKLQQSEKEIMDFINKGTSHQYWLARSFILLSEIYQSKGELFQAKETLRSLMDNYTVKDDGIMEEAEKRFNVIDNAEKAIEEKGNNSYEINLKKSKAIKK